LVAQTHLKLTTLHWFTFVTVTTYCAFAINTLCAVNFYAIM